MLRIIKKHYINSPGDATSHGNVITSPTANLKASDLDIKTGSALLRIWLAASPTNGKHKSNLDYLFYK